MRNSLIIFLALSSAMLGSLPANPAQAKDDPADPFAPLRRCRNIADVAAKAACYDRAMDALEVDRKSHKFSIVTGTQIEGLQRDAFGFNLPSLPKLRLGDQSALQDAVANGTSGKGSAQGQVLKKTKSGAVKRVAYAVSRAFTMANGHMRMVLANGQVWDQVSTDRPRFRGHAPWHVEIKKASLGSYLMFVQGSKRAIRVHRSR